jgi:hypothetical protein
MVYRALFLPMEKWEYELIIRTKQGTSHISKPTMKINMDQPINDKNPKEICGFW